MTPGQGTYLYPSSAEFNSDIVQLLDAVYPWPLDHSIVFLALWGHMQTWSVRSSILSSGMGSLAPGDVFASSSSLILPRLGIRIKANLVSASTKTTACRSMLSS